MKFKRLTVWSFSLAAGVLIASGAAADSYTPSDHQPDTTHYQRPEDLLDKVPFLSEIPRTFLFGDGYKLKLGTTDLRIDHMGTNSRNPANERTCMLGFSYTTPVAGFFTSRIDLPLLHSPDLQFADWAPSSFGDYIAYFSKGAVSSSSLQLVLTARFN